MWFFLHLMSVVFSSAYADELASGSLKYFDNYNKGVFEYGQEEIILDYVTMDNDPVSNFTEDFTVCSSMYIKYMTAENNFIEFKVVSPLHHFERLD